MSDSSPRSEASLPDPLVEEPPPETSVLARFSAPPEGFALAETLDAVPDARFAFECVVETGDGPGTTVLRATSSAPDALATALLEDPCVADASLLGEVGTERLYRVEWAEPVRTALRVLTNPSAALTEVRGSAEGWSLRALFPSGVAFSKAREFCETYRLPFDVEVVHPVGGDRGERYGLTTAQSEALRAAWRQGYYEIPRRTTLGELAGEFGVSHQALSERLRRAEGSLVREALVLSREADSASD